MTTTINADNGVVSGSAGLKYSSDSSGVLALQTNGTTAVTVDASQNTTLAGTLATSSRGITKASMPSGSVLQVVSLAANQGGSDISTSSTTFSSTGFSLSITPTSSTSKILVVASGAMTQTLTGGTGCLTTIFRGSTNLANGSTNGFAYYENSSGSGFQWVTGTMIVLDSPATTSSTTYTINFRAVNNGAGAGTAYYNINYAGNGITLMEIAA